MKNLFFLSLILGNLAFAQSSTSDSITSVSTTVTAPRSLQITYKNEISSNLEANKVTGGGFATDNQLKLTYLLGDGVRFGLFASAKTDIAGKNEIQSNREWQYGDLAAVVESVHAGILGSDKTEFAGRMYFPTSSTSIDKKQEMQLSAEFSLPYTIDSVFSYNFYFGPKYTSVQGAHDQLDTVTQIKVAANVNSYLSSYVALTHKSIISETNVLKKAIETLGPEIGANIEVNSVLNISAALVQDRAIYQPAKAMARPTFALLDSKETVYLISAQVQY